MFERDYLMRLILGYFKTIVLVVKRADKEKDPEGAAEMLERAIGEATEIDGDVLLSLAPDSIASILQVSGTDPKVVGYVAHGLLLESHYLMIACDFARAELREQQARALARAYGVDLPDDPAEAESILLDAAEQGILDEEGEVEGEVRSAGAAHVGANAAEGGEADSGKAVAHLAEQAKQARDTVFFNRDATSARFDPDAPLMQQELHESGSFGWQENDR